MAGRLHRPRPNLWGCPCELGRNAAGDYSEEKAFSAPDGR
jgi:hypothetical protein